jgi:L,D-transpeptidase YcbB
MLKWALMILVVNLPLLLFSQYSEPPGIVTNWLNNKNAIQELLIYTRYAEDLGLDTNDYDVSFTEAVAQNTLSLLSPTDSFAVDLKLTNTALTFFKHVLYGKEVPQLSYNGIKYSPDCQSLESLITASVSDKTFSSLLDILECKRPEYLLVKDSLKAAANPQKREQLIRTLNALRWMDCLVKTQNRVIVVNIPSASLLMYDSGKIVFESKVIVGTPATRTPRFITELTDIMIYPFWNVPKSIATKELLPEIRKDISYLERNNFQVLDKKGKVLLPDTINWQSLSTNYFPYTIRQSTGCDNSLGLIKFNLKTPFNVYLHDTPYKALFESQRRFFSHGCIRVQKAKELARLILKEDSLAVDTLDENASPLNYKPGTLRFAGTIAVIVLYNTAWFNASGTLKYHPDIYGLMRNRSE